MQNPFTSNFPDAFAIAQQGAALVLTSVVLFRPFRLRLSSALFIAALWWVALLTDWPAFVTGIGFKVDATTVFASGLRTATALTTVASLLEAPELFLVALLGEVLLYQAVEVAKSSNWELAVLHLCWFGCLLGVQQWRTERQDRPEGGPSLARRSFLAQDLGLAALAVVLAATVSVVLLKRECDSADEWAYTYQASIFAKLRAYAREPACLAALRNFWVFSTDGRSFSQYTPGWPLFMAPFAIVRAVWLAGPFSLGVLVLGIARLARRAVAAATSNNTVAVAAAAPIAAFTLLASNTVLINGGSRFSHLFVAATFAWSVEALLNVGDRALPSPTRAKWAAVLGVAAAWMLATRPADGAALGVGILLYALWVLASGRAGWRPVVAAALGFGIFGGFVLVILRLQLGRWFTTGYSLTEGYYPWAMLRYSLPKPDELKWGIPLATGAYCWWPLCPAIGAGGLVAALRGEGRKLVFVLSASTAALFALYSILEYGRGGTDFGYGPRYVLPALVAMSVGTAAMLAPLWVAARRHAHARTALFTGGPLLLVIAACVVGAVRLGPLIYPMNAEDVRLRNIVFREAERMKLKNAIIWHEPHTTISDSLDLTQNLPLDLYPNPDYIVAFDRTPEAHACLVSEYPRRVQYRTQGQDPVSLVR